MDNGDTVIWAYDDTLIAKGSGGNDAILLVMPEVERPQRPGIDTNVFASLQPSMAACTALYTDMPAPREIPVPIAGGAIDVTSEIRTSSGWAIRPEAVDVISAQYQ
jgi:hypothetical protein